MTAFGESYFGEFFFEEPPTVFLSYQMLSRMMSRYQAEVPLSSSVQQSFKVSHSFETRLVFQRRIAHGLSQMTVLREFAAYGLTARITRWPRSPVLKATVEHKAIRVADPTPEKIDLNRYKTDHKTKDGSWQI